MVVSEGFIPADPILIDDYSLIENVEGKIEVDFEVYALPTFDSEPEFALEIIELQANNDLLPIDHDSLIPETFYSADGYVGLVNTGSTTATFDSDKKEYYGNFAVELEANKTGTYHRDIGNTNQIYRVAQGFQLDGAQTIHAVLFKILDITGSPTGVTARIETNNAGKPSGTLAHANATKTVSAYTTTGEKTISFDTPFELSGSTLYFLKLTTQETEGANNFYGIVVSQENPYADGTFVLYGSTSYPTWEIQSANDLYFGILGAGDTTKIVVIDLPTISGTITHTQLVAKYDLESGNTIHYKLYDGTNTDDNLAIDTKNILVNVLGTGLTGQTGGLTIILKKGTGGYGDTPEVKTFCLKLWKE